MLQEVFTLKDMAEYYGVTKQYINKLKNTDDKFPKAAQTKGRIYLYTKDQVEAYGKIRDFSKPHTNRIERLAKEGAEHESTTDCH